MAIKTQMRLGQITGSMPTDAESAAARAAIVAPDMGTVLNHMASSIKRIHGAASFTEGLTGSFSQDVLPAADDTYNLGTSVLKWKDLWVDGTGTLDALVATTADINGGTVDGAVIGGASAAAATVTTLDTSGVVNLNLVTDATNSTSGALIVDGGVGIAKKLYVGTDLDVEGTANLDIVDIDGAVDMATTLAVAGTSTLAGASFSGAIDANSSADIAGSAVFSQGSGVGLQVTSAAAITGSFSVGGTSTLAGASFSGAIDANSTADIAGTVALGASGGSADTTVRGDLAVGENIAVTGTSALVGNVTITGNLDVNGTTTTIDTTNMTIEDRIIGLGVSGSTGNYSALNTGIVFGYGNKVDVQAGLSYDGAVFSLAKSTTSPASGTFAAPADADYSTLLVGTLKPGADSSTYHLGAIGAEWGDLFIDGTAHLDTVDIDAGNIDGTAIGASSRSTFQGTTGDFNSTLNVDGASTMAAITSDGAISTTSTLNADGVVTLAAAGVATTVHGTLAVTQQADFAANLDATGGVDIDADNVNLTIGAGGDLILVHNGTNSIIDNTQGNLVITGSGAGGEIQLGDGFSGAAGMLGGVLPLAVTQAEYTSYISHFSNSTSIINALNTLAEGGAREKEVVDIAAQATAVNTSGMTGLGQLPPKALDVFLNGQLMVSGSGGSGGDYNVTGDQQITFGFNAEVDDVVQFLKA
jgi:hypothetical protein